MKTFNYILLAALTLFSFVQCEQSDREKLDLTGDVDILSFTVDGFDAEVDNNTLTVKLMMPPGSDLRNLKPVVAVSEGATVSPTSNTEIDFSNSLSSPIEYNVYNKNVYSTYKVKIEEIKAKITLFKIGNIVGDINESEKTITLFLPSGMDVTKVVPTISYTEGAIISPAIGEAIDLTNPVAYTLDYANAQFHYTVNVKFGETPGLVIFNGEDVSPEWGNLAATVDSPFPNPKTDGVNSSPFCASIIKSGEDTDNGGKPWSGGALWNNNKVNIDPAEYGSFTLMVLKEVPGDIQLEIQSGDEQSKEWLKVWYSEENLGEWTKLTFKIPDSFKAVINNILVAPHSHDSGQPIPFETQRMYWDELIAIPR